MSTTKSSARGSFPLNDHNRTFKHSHLDEALDELRSFIDTPDDSAFAAVIGATAAGKTHVAKALEREIIKESAKQMKADRQFLPVIYYRIKLLTRQPSFNWTHFFKGLLTAAKHANPTFKDLNEAWAKWYQVLEDRRIKLVEIDEGAHFLTGIKPDDFDAIKAQADVIKSLVDGTPAKLVLFASYDLEPLLTTNAALVRRNQRIHLRRYLNSKEDREEFRDILKLMDRDFRGYFDFSLAENEDALYEGCLGLVGILRNWLVRSAQLAGKSKITLAYLGDRQLKAKELIAIHTDVRVGERKFYDAPRDLKRLAERLALETEELAGAGKE